MTPTTIKATGAVLCTVWGFGLAYWAKRLRGPRPLIWGLLGMGTASALNTVAILANHVKMPVYGMGAIADQDPFHFDAATHAVHFWWLCDWIGGKSFRCSPGDILFYLSVYLISFGFVRYALRKR